MREFSVRGKAQARLFQGDALEVMRQLPAESVDAVITDPPFNRGKDYGGIYNDRRESTEYLEWCRTWLKECIRLLRPTGSLYLINYPENNALLLPFIMENMKFRRWITWHYPTNIGHSRRNYTRSQHSVIFCTKGDVYTFNRSDVAVPYRNPGDRRIKERMRNGSRGKTPYDVFIYNMVKNVSREKTAHPCQIPVNLLRVFIQASTNEGDLVLDPFAGSFSTCAAALELGRNSIGIEINPEYVRIGLERLKAAGNGH
ncbi:MAG: site-specific DNA-methyltransferase [Methanomassiliicoccales archaeon]